MSKVWEDSDGCANQHIFPLTIYLMTVVSSLYEIIMDNSINEPDHGNNVVERLNPTDKHYLKEQMEHIGKLASNDTPKMEMIPSVLKYFPVKF